MSEGTKGPDVNYQFFCQFKCYSTCNYTEFRCYSTGACLVLLNRNLQI